MNIALARGESISVWDLPATLKSDTGVPDLNDVSDSVTSLKTKGLVTGSEKRMHVDCLWDTYSGKDYGLLNLRYPSSDRSISLYA